MRNGKPERQLPRMSTALSALLLVTVLSTLLLIVLESRPSKTEVENNGLGIGQQESKPWKVIGSHGVEVNFESIVDNISETTESIDDKSEEQNSPNEDIPAQGKVKVAILADASLSYASQKVLELVKAEQADMVFHPGDVGYTGNIQLWVNQTADVLGRYFPYFFSPGNYEVKEMGKKTKSPWGKYVKYRATLFKRLGVQCVNVSPEGHQVACHYGGVSFVLSSLSNLKKDLQSDLQFLKDSLSKLSKNFPATKWKFCLWHAPYETMQVGFRSPPSVMRSDLLEKGYELCRAAGAIILTGHEHYYVRTHLMDSFEKPYKFRQPYPTEGKPTLPILHVRKGSTFAVVSGLGGHSLSVPSKTYFKSRAHLAVVEPKEYLTEEDPGGKLVFAELNGQPHTTSELILEKVKDTGYPFGALFCELPIGQAKPKGKCYFKTISGTVRDEFFVTSE